MYFKYISEFDSKCINFESLLQVYFLIRKCVTKILKSEAFAYGNFFTYFYMYFRNRFKVHFKFIYFINKFLIDLKYTENYFHKIIF